MSETKYCPDCGREKPVRSFYVDRRAATGYSTYCKVHQRARVVKSYDREKQAKWREEHRRRDPSYMTRYMRAYRQKLRNTLQGDTQQ